MSLTDDWKAGKLKTGWYFTTTAKGEVCPNLWFDNEWNDFIGMVTEVLAPCDYEEIADHIDIIAKQGKKIERLKEFIRAARDTAYSSVQDCPRCGFIDNLLTKALNESEGK